VRARKRLMQELSVKISNALKEVIKGSAVQIGAEGCKLETKQVERYEPAFGGQCLARYRFRIISTRRADYFSVPECPCTSDLIGSFLFCIFLKTRNTVYYGAD
jgi:hypothetical protein